MGPSLASGLLKLGGGPVNGRNAAALGWADARALPWNKRGWGDIWRPFQTGRDPKLPPSEAKIVPAPNPFAQSSYPDRPLSVSARGSVDLHVGRNVSGLLTSTPGGQAPAPEPTGGAPRGEGSARAGSPGAAGAVVSR